MLAGLGGQDRLLGMQPAWRADAHGIDVVARQQRGIAWHARHAKARLGLDRVAADSEANRFFGHGLSNSAWARWSLYSDCSSNGTVGRQPINACAVLRLVMIKPKRRLCARARYRLRATPTAASFLMPQCWASWLIILLECLTWAVAIPSRPIAPNKHGFYRHFAPIRESSYSSPARAR